MYPRCCPTPARALSSEEEGRPAARARPRVPPGPHRVRAAHGVPVARAPRPTRFVHDPTVHHYVHKWALQGVFERAWFDMARWYLYLYKRVRPADARRRSRHRARTAVVDASFVKNVHGRDVLGRNPTDRGRNATKVSMLTDARGEILRWR